MQRKTKVCRSRFGCRGGGHEEADDMVFCGYEAETLKMLEWVKGIAEETVVV